MVDSLQEKWSAAMHKGGSLNDWQIKPRENDLSDPKGGSKGRSCDGGTGQCSVV